MPVNQRLVDAAKPIVDALKSGDDIRRARKVDRALDAKGRAIVDAVAFGAEWNSSRPLIMQRTDGTRFHVWIESNGRVRVKQGRATFDGDGGTIGSQV